MNWRQVCSHRNHICFINEARAILIAVSMCIRWNLWLHFVVADKLNYLGCVYVFADVYEWDFWTCNCVLFVFAQSGPVFFGVQLCQAVCFSPTFVAVMKAMYGKQHSGLLSPPTDDILPSFPLSSSCLHLIWFYISKATPQNGKKSNTNNIAAVRQPKEQAKSHTSSQQLLLKHQLPPRLSLLSD